MIKSFIVTREMEDARTRLEAYKNKIQPYPSYPEEDPSEGPTRVRVTNLRMTDTQISYLRRNLIQYIDKKFKELQDKTKVDKQYKYKKYIS